MSERDNRGTAAGELFDSLGLLVDVLARLHDNRLAADFETGRALPRTTDDGYEIDPGRRAFCEELTLTEQDLASITIIYLGDETSPLHSFLVPYFDGQSSEFTVTELAPLAALPHLERVSLGLLCAADLGLEPLLDLPRLTRVWGGEIACTEPQKAVLRQLEAKGVTLAWPGTPPDLRPPSSSS